MNMNATPTPSQINSTADKEVGPHISEYAHGFGVFLGS